MDICLNRVVESMLMASEASLINRTSLSFTDMWTVQWGCPKPAEVKQSIAPHTVDLFRVYPYMIAEKLCSRITAKCETMDLDLTYLGFVDLTASCLCTKPSALILNQKLIVYNILLMHQVREFLVHFTVLLVWGSFHIHQDKLGN